MKAHKCVELVHLQADLGAVGLTCQTLREAEVMAATGFDDLLIPHNHRHSLSLSVNAAD